MRQGGQIVVNQQDTPQVVKATEDTRKERGYAVVKANTLVQRARHSLTEQELKLVDYMVSTIKPDDDELKPIKTTIQHINSVLGVKGGNSSKITADALLKLTNKGFWMETDDGMIQTTRWLDRAKVNPKTGNVELKLDATLVPYLLKLTKNYTRYTLGDIVSLRGRYAIMLYQLQASWYAAGSVYGTVDEFLEYFGKLDMKWYRFNDKYLKPAIAEVNEKTWGHIHVATRKHGNKVAEVEFSFREVD